MERASDREKRNEAAQIRSKGSAMEAKPMPKASHVFASAQSRTSISALKEREPSVRARSESSRLCIEADGIMEPPRNELVNRRINTERGEAAQAAIPEAEEKALAEAYPRGRNPGPSLGGSGAAAYSPSPP